MTQAAWSSEAIRVSDAACFDVKASGESVVLGLFVGHGEVAADHHLTPALARKIGAALIQGADESERAAGVKA